MASPEPIVRPIARYYRRIQLNGVSRMCHPRAVVQWRAIDVCDEPEVTFVNEELSRQFACVICMDVISDPITVGCSGYHIFCKKCIQQTIRSTRDINDLASIPCPSCRDPFAIADIRDDDFAKRMIRSLIVKCTNHEITEKRANLHQQRVPRNGSRPRRRSRERNAKDNIKAQARSRSRSRERDNNHNNDQKEENKEEHKEEVLPICDWTGEYRNLSEHLLVCAFSIVWCEECLMPLLRNEMEAHVPICPWLSMRCNRCQDEYVQCELHICPLEIIACRFCGVEVQRNIEKVHWGNCPRVQIDCEFMDLGCSQLVMRENMTEHLREHNLKHLSMMRKKCNEFNVLNQKYEQLRENYEELEGKHDDLERRYDEMEEEHQGLEANHEELESEHAILQQDHDELQQEHDTLELRVDGIESLTTLLVRRVIHSPNDRD